MSAAHTPGEWIAQPDPSAMSGDDWCIGTVDQIDAVAVCSKRDAQLIAAAPEMLTKLEKVAAWLDRLADQSEKDAKDTRFVSLAKAHADDAINYRATAYSIRTVIAKATGEAA